MNNLEKSYAVLDDLRLPHGLYLASPSDDYHYVWLRDSFYEVLPYLTTDCTRYEDTYHRILDLFRDLEWKLDIHQSQRPGPQWQYIHARYDARTLKELDMPWGHAQHDAVGAILFGIAEGERVGKTILRDFKDKEIVQKIVGYLECCRYWEDPDNGMWEEWREVHASSVGAVVAGLQALDMQNIVNVPGWLIAKGRKTLMDMLPFESDTRPVDLAQLSLIYPYNILPRFIAETILERVEQKLLRERGVIRYQTDSYYSLIDDRGIDVSAHLGKEAEWTFGLPWLAICNFQLGNEEKALDYLQRAENVMLPDGSLPELYFSGKNEWNGNTPLGWSNALYILAMNIVKGQSMNCKNKKEEESR